MGDGFDAAMVALRALPPLGSKELECNAAELKAVRARYGSSLDYIKDDAWHVANDRLGKMNAATMRRIRMRQKAAEVAALLSIVEGMENFPAVEDPDVALLVEKAIKAFEYEFGVENGRRNLSMGFNSKAEADAMRDGRELINKAREAITVDHPARTMLWHACSGGIRRTILEHARPALRCLRGEDEEAIVAWRASLILKREADLETKTT